MLTQQKLKNEEGNQKMVDKDLSVGVVSIPQQGALSKKPSYLISLEVKKGASQFFLTTDRPEMLQGFVSVRGLFLDPLIEGSDVRQNYTTLLNDATKESMVEIMFPWHKIVSMQSLVFRAK